MNKRHILLLGASGGIGSQLASMFSNDILFSHHYTSPSLSGPQSVHADLTNESDVATMVSGLISQFGWIDILINASGVSKDGFAHKSSYVAWRSVIDINLIGSFNAIRAVLPSMRERHYGRIVTLGSVVCQRPVLGTSAYSAAKAGLAGLTRTVAIENATMGITCNCIALGYFDAGMGEHLQDDVKMAVLRDIPMQRFGRVAEIHQTIEYLVETEYITGQVLSLNGGLYAG